MSRRKYSYNDYNKSKPRREATKYFIIYEGKSKEPNYFEAFNEKFIDNKLAYVCHVLEEDTGVIGNTPLKLIERAEKFLKEPPVNIKVTPAKDDRFRFVIDVDRHPSNHLKELKAYCTTLDNGEVYISNFCFEIWLWAHYYELSDIQSTNSKEMKTELGTITIAQYPHSFMEVELITNAIARCKSFDTNVEDFIPEVKTSKVYQLIEELIPFTNLI
jgi:hypothetical protein